MKQKNGSFASICYAVAGFGFGVLLFARGSLPDYEAAFGSDSSAITLKAFLIGAGDLLVPLLALFVLATGINFLPSGRTRRFLAWTVVVAAILEMAWMLWLRHLLIQA